MATSKKLNNRRETFARLVASGSLTNTEAARRAGYRHPDRLGHRLRNVAAVQEMIAQIRSNIRTPEEALDDYLQLLEDIREEAMATGQYMAAVRAQVAIGRALGFFDRPVRASAPEAPALSSGELAQRIASRLGSVKELVLKIYDEE